MRVDIARLDKQSKPLLSRILSHENLTFHDVRPVNHFAASSTNTDVSSGLLNIGE